MAEGGSGHRVWRGMAGRTGVIIAGVLIVVAVVFLIVTSTANTARYFLTVEELQAQREELAGRDVTISGAVLGETIEYDLGGPQVTFTVVQVPGDPRDVERAGGLAQVLADAVRNPDATRLQIVYRGVKPDLLQHESQAILRGRLEEDGVFYASEILLKCPTRYEESVPGQSEGW